VDAMPDQLELTWAQRHHPKMHSAYDDAPDGRSLQARFKEFHRDNPEVYLELLKLARKARRGGMEKVSIKMLYEVVRWHRLLETTDKIYKLNNNYHAAYARLLMDENQELRGLFETRESPRK
jgi:hypothetical protein